MTDPARTKRRCRALDGTEVFVCASVSRLALYPARPLRRVCARTKSSPVEQEDRTRLPPACCESADAMDETGTFHPIACESCRSKKSKCDRELPVCSQCGSSNTLCRYPPVNKRGIPSGYVSFIEQRLLETEIVVLELLSAIYNSHVPIEPQRLSERDCLLLAEYSQKQAKSHKIEEWKNLPLATEVQRRTWWLEKTERIAKAEDANGDQAAQKSPVATSPWIANSPRSIHQEGTQNSVATQSAYVPMQHPSQPQPSWHPVTDGSGQSELDTNLCHLDQQTTGFSIMENMAGEQCPDIPEVPTSPPSHSILQSHSLADARWRKYF